MQSYRKIRAYAYRGSFIKTIGVFRMNKIMGLLIGICAFFVALFYVVSKRDFRKDFSADNLSAKRRFLTTVALFIAFLSCGETPAARNRTSPTGSVNNIADTASLEDIEKTGEWVQLRKRWSDLKKAESWSAIDLQKEVEKQKKVNDTFLSLLAAKGYFSQNVAYILNYIYGELLFHRLRSTSSWTCYKMTRLGSALSGTRRDLENQLKLLSDINGTINKKVFDAAKDNIARDIEFLNRAEEIFEKGKKNQHAEDYWEEEKALANLFKDGKVDARLKADEAATRAAELIARMNINKPVVVTDQRTRLNQLKHYKEWQQIKSNWQNVSEIKSVGYDAMEKMINKKKKETKALLNKLVSLKIFTNAAATVFNDIYGDRIYHHLRPMAATCYEPTVLGWRQQQTRNDIENQLRELEEIAKKGTMKKTVLEQARQNLKKSLEIVLLVNELWEKQKNGDWEKYADEEKEILSFFTADNYNKADINDEIKIREGVEEAMGIIQLIYKD